MQCLVAATVAAGAAFVGRVAGRPGFVVVSKRISWGDDNKATTLHGTLRYVASRAKLSVRFEWIQMYLHFMHTHRGPLRTVVASSAYPSSFLCMRTVRATTDSACSTPLKVLICTHHGDRYQLLCATPRTPSCCDPARVQTDWHTAAVSTHTAHKILQVAELGRDISEVPRLALVGLAAYERP